ncbi:hypothetical protein ACFL13_02280, partial [Patescibacteria group bacterium]
FVDKGKILGSSFSVGSADIKLLQDVAGGVDIGNLVDEKTGPTFEGVSPNWTSDYLIKIYNNAAGQLQITSNANYETINDPDDLRQIIFVEPISWNDSNGDGIFDAGEEGTSFGRKTIVKWKTEGFDFGTINSGNVLSLILRFSTDTVSDTKQGSTGIFDFEFDSIGLE